MAQVWLTEVRKGGDPRAVKNAACKAPTMKKYCGVYRRSVMLASGRYAMLDDGRGFSLVPYISAANAEGGCPNCLPNAVV
ncbi:DUF3363 domain-containing protein [Parazoarcus communis]|uniref:DUF3363 domain-containing protein n=1 Tax=Parazoarcus communis TaxID=41977 RepID=UPI0026D34E99